jgi:hypothetical protein
MFIIIPGIHLFLLQDWVFFKDDNPMEAIIALAGLGVIIVFAIIFKLVRRGVNPTVVGKGRPGAITQRKFNIFTFRRIASSYRLDRDQTKLLEYVFRNDGVIDPLRVMQNPALLDRHFKRAFRSIEKNSNTDEEAQQHLQKLFSLRNVIEAGAGEDELSHAKLSENTPAILICGKENYQVKVITSRGKNVLTDIPRNVLGTPVRLPKGTKINLSFFTKSSNGFSLEGQIVGSINTDFGPCLQIQHTGISKPLVKRKFRRKHIDIATEFFFVNVEETGTKRKKTTKLVVDQRKFKGTVNDISVGGCSLQTSSPIPVGSRLKLIMDHEDTHVINVLGQVIRSNRSKRGTVIHIKFLKVPRRSFNSISTMVFGYNES